jgi:hypothetical protein
MTSYSRRDELTRLDKVPPPTHQGRDLLSYNADNLCAKNHDSSEGKTYVERYKLYDYPHIAIVDPRTGRSLWKKKRWTQEKPFTAEHFAEMAMDFCSRHSFDKAPLPSKKNSMPSGNGERKRPVMSEEEQLQAAVVPTPQKMSDKQIYCYSNALHCTVHPLVTVYSILYY